MAERFSRHSPDGPPHRPELRKTAIRQKQTSRNPTCEEQMAGFRGWNERGYLPHRDEPGLTQFVTFRLIDSFPEELREEWGKLLLIENDRERRVQLEAWLDLGKGKCHLRDERVAKIVEEALCRFDGTHYRLIAWVMMPNHVHVLFEAGNQSVAKTIKEWKGSSGRAANRILQIQKGSFWQADYWDTYMRDADHRATTIRYLRNNPVKAALLEDWQKCLGPMCVRKNEGEGVAEGNWRCFEVIPPS